MKKRFLSLFVAVVACSTAAFAQLSAVATLKHGSNISYYYGVSALAKAYTAAATGDVITLSSGIFDAVNIEKAITVRGAGMLLANDNPTLLLGSFKIIIPVGTSSLTLEGVQCMDVVEIYSNKNNETDMTRIASARILKCYFVEDVRCGNSTPLFMHCVFQKVISSNLKDMPIEVSDYPSTTVTCQNCAIYGAASHGKMGERLATIDMQNCFLHGGMFYIMSYSKFHNCIIIASGGPASYPNTTHYVSNSLCLGGTFEQISQVTNTIIDNYELSTIFKTFTDTFSPNETFELTDQAKTKYKGSDGTQVGIYGGTNPFNPTPTNPQVKKFNVSTTTTDGKLNVKINVE